MFMKIKIKDSSFNAIKPKKREKIAPKKQSKLLKGLINLISKGDFKKTEFKYVWTSGQDIPINQPCLILMNHSSFIDLEILFSIFKDRKFNIVTTDDAFIGKDWLLRKLGCLPALKFQNDVPLILDMKHVIQKLKSSVVLFPEASYSFDGTATLLPDSIPGLIKYLKVPVLMVRTHGAFLRDPLYNNLQVRDVKVSCEISCIITNEQLSLPAEEIATIINKQFEFDNFKEQQNNGIIVDEPFRADYLNRVLYKCPHCGVEYKMIGQGTSLVCTHCNEEYELTENGYLDNVNGNTLFNHVPDWFSWERECVREEVFSGKYAASVHGCVYATIDHKAVYKLGKGSLYHDINGFVLKDDKGNTVHEQKSLACYSLYSDFYWYEVGDIVSIGTQEIRYYIVPKEKDVVAKLRLATEEIYKFLQTKQK